MIYNMQEAKNTETKQRRKQTNANFLANLKPFQKEQTGNPYGRPEGAQNLSTILKQMLLEIAPETILDSEFIRAFCKGKTNVTIAYA